VVVAFGKINGDDTVWQAVDHALQGGPKEESRLMARALFRSIDRLPTEIETYLSLSDIAPARLDAE
jgi:hypothetical protein